MTASSASGVSPIGVPAAPAQVYYPINNNAYSRSISALICPSNPSVASGGTVVRGSVTWGASCYAFNALLFSKENGINFTTTGAGYTANGKSYDPYGGVKIAHITDGTSNTIILAERYPSCTNQSYPEGGSFWAFSALSSPALPAPNNPPTKCSYPGFQISFFASLPGGTNALGLASKFQTRPFPFEGTGSQCNPVMAQSPHADNMPVCLADCTVRTLSAGISPGVWWASCTHTGGESVSLD